MGPTPTECHDRLVPGLFADTTLGLTPDSGAVYALTEFEALRQTREGHAEDTEERVGALRARITAFDPLPFADEDSRWNPTVEEVVDGIW
ncbi:SUKH-4 family immunity protein [Streptomyces cinereoruber]|uniref:SUKH-4 family immunity protein n=1 Tax=Streptomyces cinereoruber TaxID=67260 RepID=UPI003EBCE054